jgi:hypothetical protein
MKKSIIYLGIFAAMFVNTSFAKTVEIDQQNLETEVSRTDLNLSSENKLSKPLINIESEDKVIASIEVISSHYKKPIEEIIEEDKKITESTEELYQPLYIAPTIEDYIRLDNQIIDSTIPNEVYPIDFELINQSYPMSNLEIRPKDAIKS